jgi:hypothetical protein
MGSRDRLVDENGTGMDAFHVVYASASRLINISLHVDCLLYLASM